MIKNNFKNRLFGRTRGRSKKKFDLEKYKDLLYEHRVPKFNNSLEYILDIGTGYGETSIFLANKFKSKIIISCEKYVDGNLNLLKKINDNNIKNIKIHPGNAYDILDKNRFKKYFNLIWIFFPDPWPKKKHHKRRLITSDFLNHLHTFLKTKGEICIVTDSISYIRFILNNLYKSKNLYKWTNQHLCHLTIKDYYDLETKFYKKAIISGKKPLLLILKKI